MSFLLFESFFVYFLLEERKSAGLLADVGEDAAVNVEDQAARMYLISFSNILPI